MTRQTFRTLLPLLLSLNAGYTDTAGFLGLHGLFTAHVTGNFVTLAASLVQGTSGALAKLLALPVFCVVVIAVRLLGTLLTRRNAPVFEILVGLKILLLAIGAILAIRLGPFPDGDHWQAVLTGMVLVSAMAIQNAVHRVHLASAPPSTLMTGTTTQVMLDLADTIYARTDDDKRAPSKLVPMSINVLAFALGCALAAVLYLRFDMWCFIVPPILGTLALVFRLVAPPQVAPERS